LQAEDQTRQKAAILKAQELQLAPKGNTVTLVMGPFLCYVGYLLYTDYNASNVSIGFMVFGAIVFIVGCLAYLWKNPIVFLLDSFVFCSLVILFLLNPRSPYSEKSTGIRVILGVGLIGFTVWKTCCNIQGYLAMRAVRLKRRNLGLSIEQSESESTAFINSEAKENISDNDFAKYVKTTNSATVKNAKCEEYNGLTEDNLIKIAKQTYQAWETGVLNSLNPRWQEDAKQVSLDVLIELYADKMELFKIAYKNQPPDDNECVLHFKNAGVRCSYLMTNMYFYFFGLDSSAFANKYENIKIPLSEITDCSFKKGLVMYKATITLKSGQVIHIKDLMDEIPMLYIKRFLEEKDLLKKIQMSHIHI
jgi:hypothetical protein